MTFESSRLGTHEADDEQALRGTEQGDRSALVTLYNRHAPALLAHLTLVTGDRGLAEEVLQDTMLAIWRNAGSFKNQSSVRSWIFSIARRQARDRLRRRRPKVVSQELLSEHPAAEPGPEDIVFDRAKAAMVAREIKRLSVVHREVLNLTFGTGLSLAETAAVLDVPIGTVKSRLSAARAALANALTKNGFE
ncbi:RNA polymerase sigma factor [Nonomuraea sp. NPDC050404]|uniref:RNA polymerase sigma factor n=1 Tax=Nonomuraea sp. NPDC050404 TaxID=3155783 RepID=UPI0034045B48